MADTKISALNTLDNTTVAAADLVPVVDTSANETKAIRYDKLMTPQDVHFRIVGSSDGTKKVAFEVDGLTTATTRTLTVSDEDGTILTNNNTVTVNNKTIGTGTKIAVGSDATGDLHYRDSSGNLTRLAIGSPNQILNANASGVPEWIANPAATNGSTTANGTFEEATSAEINAGTATGSTGARLAVTAAGLAASAPTFSGANLTNLPGPLISLSATNSSAVTNTNIETTVATVSIPANTLSTNKALRVSCVFFMSWTSNSSTLTLRIKYGGTALGAFTYTPGSAITQSGYTFINGIIMSAGTTSSQEANFQALEAGMTDPATVANKVQLSVANTSAIDSTTSQNLTITAQWSTTSSSITTTLHNYVVEKII